MASKDWLVSTSQWISGKLDALESWQNTIVFIGACQLEQTRMHLLDIFV